MTNANPCPNENQFRKKHSVRYDAVGSEAAVTSVYIMKSALPAKVPQSLTITIEMENE